MEDLSAPTGREPELTAVPREDGTPPLALVFGGTGYIGGRLVPRLLTAGYRVRVLARDLSRVAAFTWGDERRGVEGDAADPVAVARAVEGVDVLYYLVHSMSAGKGFEAADRGAAENVAKAAAAAAGSSSRTGVSRSSVKRIVYLGGLHPDGVELSPHLRSRVEVGEVLLASGVPTLVLQAGVVIGSGSASFEMVRHLTDVLPYMPAPKWVRNRIQPIAVRDVLYYLLGGRSRRARRQPRRRHRRAGRAAVRADDERLRRRGGPAAAGDRRAAGADATARVAWVNLVTPIPASIARPLVESLQNECVMKDHEIDDLIPPPESGLTPYRRAVALALGACARRCDRDELAGCRGAGRSERPAAERPRLGWSDGLHGLALGVDVPATPERLWRVIEGIGGENGWYSSPLLWAVRGWMDRLVGGHRAAPAVVAAVTGSHVGDALDFWRVEAIERGIVAAAARRDEGARVGVAGAAGDARRRRLALRPARALLSAGSRGTAVLAGRPAVPRPHLHRHGEPHHRRSGRA